MQSTVSRVQNAQPPIYVGETKRKLCKPRMDEHKRAVRMADFK